MLKFTDYYRNKNMTSLNNEGSFNFTKFQKAATNSLLLVFGVAEWESVRLYSEMVHQENML